MTTNRKNAARDVLEGAIRDSFSPKAVVAIAAHLFGASTRDEGVNKEMRWFADRLLSMVGVDEYNRLLEEVGL